MAGVKRTERIRHFSDSGRKKRKEEGGSGF
jgi:hypothetical protein